MKNNEMSSKDRLEALLNGKPVDRVPHLSFILGFCAKNVGYTVESIYGDPEKSFAAQVHTREQYGYDSYPFYGYAAYGGMEFGGKVKMPTGEYEQAPSHTRFAVSKEQDVEQLRLPDPKSAGMLPQAMRFSMIQVENDMPPSIVVGGPFTVAGNICIVETLCRWLIKKPELANYILRMATEHLIEVVAYWISTFGKGKVNIQIWEPLASNQIISPKQFEKFVLPYQIEFHKKIIDMGIKHILCHVCGEQTRNLPYWQQVPMGRYGIISIGHEIDITDAITYFGNTCIIAGNIEPATIQTGTPKEIYTICREIILKGRNAPTGFAFMEGCEVPVNTPPYNLYTIRKAINDFGKYHTI